MSVQDLSAGDFDHFTRYADGMRACHEAEFVKKIDPDLMKAMYRGKTSKEDRNNPSNLEYLENDTKHLLAFSRLFQATNTIIPNLYYQNPSPIVLAGRGSDQNSTALMSSILKHYMKLNRAKEQNQEAILNAWFFGMGWKKIGYRTVFLPRVDEPESQIDNGVLDKLRSAASSLFGKPDNTESKERPELVDYETLFNDSESPMNVMVDHKADLLNCKAILHRIPRTIYDLENYGDYDEELLKELEANMKDKYGSRFSSRESDVMLNELHIQQRNGIWILTFADGFTKPLRYDKSTYAGKGFLFSPIVFTNEPGVRYPISHMKVASQVQSKQDKLATMFVELIARSVNLTVVNEKALAPGQKDALEKNLLRGILSMKDKFSAQDIQSFSSGNVPQSLQPLMAMLQQNITEILGTDEQMVGGKSSNDTLGQDELARSGTKIRSSGMQDRVRDWMINQFEKEGTLIKQFSNHELHVVITGKDYSDPLSGEKVEDKWVEFGTERNPLGAKHSLQGQFDYDIDIEEAIKPNKQAQQQQYEKMMVTLANPAMQDALLQDNSRARTGLILKRWMETFSGIGNPDMFVEQLDSRQVAAIQASKVMMQSGGNLSPKVSMSEEAVPQESDVTSPSSEQAQ